MKFKQSIIFTCAALALLGNSVAVSKVIDIAASRNEGDVANTIRPMIQEESDSQIQINSDSPVEWHPGENLVIAIPIDWKLAFEAHQESYQIVEFVPSDQTIENWEDLLTIQVFENLAFREPQVFFGESVALVQQVCPGIEVAPPIYGEENGYSFVLWVQLCLNNPLVNQAEITTFKGIQGNDSFYVVQRAWRVPSLVPGAPIQINGDELEEWGHFMSLVWVCDTRIPEQSCPN